MSTQETQQAIERTRKRLNQRLQEQAEKDGHWEGQLSSSALATATAVVALKQADDQAYQQQINEGLAWLAANANEDGGWGDTTRSKTNIATTSLCWAAFAITESPDYKRTITAAEAWITTEVGGLEPSQVKQAIMERYAEDHSFSIPILTMLALCGRLGADGWELVTPLPFEMAAAPHQIYRWLRMPVVSYALPALIAIGQVIYHNRRQVNPVTGLLRKLTKKRTLALLQTIQPQNGGYLEAIPLTSFVVMSLAAMGLKGNPVLKKGVAFLKARVRKDGSWPIDTHLATWLTSLTVNAMAEHLTSQHRAQLQKWLLAQQNHEQHPYTHAAPGGWSWTPQPGGVPDADDTSAALLALYELAPDRAKSEARQGINWLLGLQNKDGGMPSFCRGWGTLPFDKSSADITAHALAAITAWGTMGAREPTWERAEKGMLQYLLKAQRPDGSWVPLWFGNQHEPNGENPVFGTAKVLIALETWHCAMPEDSRLTVAMMITMARQWLVQQANEEGGWGGAKDLPATIEETALAVEALAATEQPLQEDERCHIEAGLNWLVEHTQEGTLTQAAPIGYYFANLWYFEELYPQIFAVSAMNRARQRELTKLDLQSVLI